MKKWDLLEAPIAPIEDYHQRYLFYSPEFPLSPKKQKTKPKKKRRHEYINKELPLEYSDSHRKIVHIKRLNRRSGFEGDLDKERRKNIKTNGINGIGTVTSPSLCEEQISNNLNGELPARNIFAIEEENIESENKAQIYGKIYHKLAQIVTIFYLSRNFYQNTFPKHLVQMLIGPLTTDQYNRKLFDLTQDVRPLSNFFDEFTKTFADLSDSIDLDQIREVMEVNYSNIEIEVIQFCLRVLKEWKNQIKLMSSDLAMSTKLFDEIFLEMYQNPAKQLQIIDSVLKILDEALIDINPDNLINIVTEKLVMISYRIPKGENGFYYSKLNKLDEIRVTSKFIGDLILIYKDDKDLGNEYDLSRVYAKVIDYKINISKKHRVPDVASNMNKIQYILGVRALVEKTGGFYRDSIIAGVNPRSLDLSGITFYYADLGRGELLNATPHAHELSTLVDYFQILIETEVMFKKSLKNIIAEQ